MKTTLIALTAGSLVLAAVATPAFATRKKCEAGTFWSSKARACVLAGAQAKPQKMCLFVNEENGVTEVPCSTVQ